MNLPPTFSPGVPSPLGPHRPLAQSIGSHWHRAPSPAPGFGLLGIIVGLALSAAVVGVGYTLYVHNQQASDIAKSTQEVQAIKAKVLSSYASAPDFSQLNQTSAVREGLFVTAGAKTSPAPTNVWGGPVLLAPINVAGTSGPGNNNGFALTFEDVAANVCARFALHGGASFYDVKVNNLSVMVGSRVDVSRAAQACAQSNGAATVQFIQAKASPNGPQSPTLTPCVPPADGLQHLNCPAGQLSSVAPYTPVGITQTNHSFCTNPYGAYGTTPWQTTVNTCVPACVAPAPVVTPGAQTASCPAGQVTIASGAATFPQTNTQTTTYTCPLPIGSASPIVNPPTAWTPLASNVCAPKCVAPPATTDSQSITGTCPAGQVTNTGATTFAQTQTRGVTYACPAPTGGYTTAYGAWSAATPAASSVCAPKCTAPGPSSYPNYQWVSTSPGCPGGQTGTYSYQYQQVQTVTTTYSCPAPQGGYTSSTSAGGWSNTGATQAVVNTCTPVTPPAPNWCNASNRTTFGPSPSAVGVGIKACTAANVGQQAFGKLVSCSGVGPCGGYIYAATCTAGGWQYSWGPGSSPYVMPPSTLSAPWDGLRNQGDGDWSAAGKGLPSMNYVTYSCS